MPGTSCMKKLWVAVAHDAPFHDSAKAAWLLSANVAKYGWLTTFAPWYYIDGFISRTFEKKFCFITTKFMSEKESFYVKILDIRTLDSLEKEKKISSFIL